MEGKAESRISLPGDELLPNAKAQFAHEITIDAPTSAIWPWLIQMGCQRAGWYSYDRLDNGGIPSANRIVPELQHLEVGDILPGRPEGKEGFRVEKIELYRALVLSSYTDLRTRKSVDPDGPTPKAFWRTTWAFILDEVDEKSTRLTTRARGDWKPHFLILPFVHLVARPIHFIMERKQLKEIKKRAEKLYTSQLSEGLTNRTNKKIERGVSV